MLALGRRRGLRLSFLLPLLPALVSCMSRGDVSAAPGAASFVEQPERFIIGFRGSEGIAFSREGRLFIGANNAIWLATAGGAVRQIAQVYRHLGQAAIGARDILAADFGPTNAFADGPNDDGIIWRITPEGKKTVYATGIGDPNALVQLHDGTWLVSDDATHNIYRLHSGKAEIWSQSVPFPNGLAISPDGKTLYAAQSFSAIGPVVADDKIWAIAIRDGNKAGAARVIAKTEAAPDGLAVDDRGRLYIADNGSGTLRRLDPETGEQVVLARGLTHIASLAFGRGRFDRESIYATSTEKGGGAIWRIKVHAKGASCPGDLE